MKKYTVKVKRLTDDHPKELSDTYFKSCNFCNKTVKITPINHDSCIRLAGDKFYCPFCLRHNFHHKNGNNVLIMSFRSIIGFLYYRHYIGNNNPPIFLNQIKSAIKDHIKIGLVSPVFSYDSDTYLWFIDFNRVGTTKRKAPFGEVMELTVVCFDAFGLPGIVSNHSIDHLWSKYEESMELFYKQRQRPKDKKMLIPTFRGSGIPESIDFYEKTRCFTKYCLSLK